ncbi:MAG: SprT-like domain-containing protein [Campylobacterota bacterium]|nr:SprT-like domain-containing protein [Campylobacterota bacterium]
MFKKRLEIIFISIILIAVAVLASNYYKSYSFKNNDIPDSYKQRIFNKEQEVLQHMKNNFGFTFKVPLIVTDKFKGKLYGLTSYENGEIKIYLNKKVMQESMDYMVDSVIAHEYAHALMFKEGYIHTKDDGHSKLWQQTCTKLGGVDCQQYVDQKEIIMSKMPFQ